MLAVAIAFFAAAASADAGAQAPPPASAAAPVPAKLSDQERQNKVECRTLDETGSRLGGQRICKTHAQWVEDARRSRDATEAQQNGGFVTNGH